MEQQGCDYGSGPMLHGHISGLAVSFKCQMTPRVFEYWKRRNESGNIQRRNFKTENETLVLESLIKMAKK